MKLLHTMTILTLGIATAFNAQAADEGSGSKNKAEPKKGNTPAAFETPEGATSLPVGATIPDVTVQNAKGEDVPLRKLVAKQKTALIYYRGGWCPFCNKHLKEVQEIKDDIEAAGYQIVAISADTPDKVAEAVKSGAVDFTLLSDSSMEAARAFNLAFIVDAATRERYKQMMNLDFADAQGNVHNSLPVPAFFLIDTNGKIKFEHHDADYKARLSKEEILAAIK